MLFLLVPKNVTKHIMHTKKWQPTVKLFCWLWVFDGFVAFVSKCITLLYRQVSQLKE